MASETTAARRLEVRGTVQGVGFRPFVYRLARELDLKGWVLNDTRGVAIHVEGDPSAIDSFALRIERDAPPAAVVGAVEISETDRGDFDCFEIRRSETSDVPVTRISSDLCVCGDCLCEMRDPSDRRHGYAYINCTNCGPRYSIINSLPYDRPRTTMADWPLCDACRAEYDDPCDRRFHAQPVACPMCGPSYRLRGSDPDDEHQGRDAIARTAELLCDGQILAIKGIGGYHLACNATDIDAVRRLRERKFRKEKPFAVMASSLARADELVGLTEAHRELLVSAARPIVLAPVLAELDGVAPGNRELGVMLPYTPLHVLLFDDGAPDPIVLTSANRSNEPIAYSDTDALERLEGIADAFLIGERPIRRRVDDSVVAVRRGAPFIIRRSRGYAPASVASLETARPVLAVGSDLKNTIALATGGEVFVSQHIGDLADMDTQRAFMETIDDLLEMYRIDRSELVVAHDMHPEYFSTRIAKEIECASHIPVQHHEAHVASVLLDQDASTETVLGVVLDGTGFGRDGTTWGGEFLRGSVQDGFERVASLEPVQMPGGDAAARHPVQAAAAYLKGVEIEHLEQKPIGFPSRFRQARSLIESNTRCATSTSAGRVFDAAAAVCGFTRETTFEGQAAIWLEQLAGRAVNGAADHRHAAETSSELIQSLVERRLAGDDPATVAAAFHEMFAKLLLNTLECFVSERAPLVLSGGVWQNERLLSIFTDMVQSRRVLTPTRAPVNDGGISIGQVYIASRFAGV
ncbi:MAG: carbamoyltransferase HypF [Planctomycetota bacterium]